MLSTSETAATRARIDLGTGPGDLHHPRAGLVFGFVYGGPLDHSVTSVLAASVAISFPLLLLMIGRLVWIGIGFALAPGRVDPSARRRRSRRRTSPSECR
jgi:hypothetical protein